MHPAAWARATRSACTPHENDTSETRSSAHTSSRSDWSKASTRFTQNGRSVSRLIARICSRRAAGSVHDAPRQPMPPAPETAATSAGLAAGPSGACMTGTSHGIGAVACTAAIVVEPVHARADAGGTM